MTHIDGRPHQALRRMHPDKTTVNHLELAQIITTLARKHEEAMQDIERRLSNLEELTQFLLGETLDLNEKLQKLL